MIFTRQYSRLYDTLYAQKPYAKEAKNIEGLFKKYSKKDNVQKILDLGCGTGNHALYWAKKGYDVLGIDQSLPMLKLAKGKARKGKYALRFQQGRAQSLKLNKQFDAVIMMFAVFGYQNSNQNIRKMLRLIKRHLRKGGVLIFDVWYGPSISSNALLKTKKELGSLDGFKWVRFSNSRINSKRHLIKVTFKLVARNKAKKKHAFQETHSMRYFFRDELRKFLKRAGFSWVKIFSWPELKNRINSKTRSICVVARV